MSQSWSRIAMCERKIMLCTIIQAEAPVGALRCCEEVWTWQSRTPACSARRSDNSSVASSHRPVCTSAAYAGIPAGKRTRDTTTNNQCSIAASTIIKHSWPGFRPDASWPQLQWSCRPCRGPPRTQITKGACHFDSTYSGIC